MNVADGLRINSWRYPDKVAAVLEDKRLNYKELNARSNQFAHAMMKMGFKRGHKISIILYNCIEFLEIYHGLARIGAVSVPINFRLALPEIEYIIDNSDSVCVITNPEFLETLNQEKLKKVPKNHYIIVSEKDKTPENMQNYEEMLVGMPDYEPCDVEIKESDLFYLGYTSGTTGFPKGAMIQIKGILNIIQNALVRTAGRKGIDITQRVMLAIMPICHSNSIWATLITFWVGGTNVIFPSGKFAPEKVLKIIEKEKVTTSSMVPTMITKILDLPDEVKNRYDLTCLSSLGCSSAPLLTKTKETALQFFKNARFSEGYGSTETGALTTLRHKDQMRKVRSIGKPNPGIEIKLIDEDGNEVTETGKVGVLWAKAPSAFIGYYKDQEKTEEAIKGEWSTAGDMAYIDEEGYYYLVDRKHDMIISGGENIYPAEIEEILIKHPKISEVAVIGVPHQEWGEEIKAVVLLKDDAEATEEEIISFCKDRLAGYKRPRSVDFVEDFPRTATGKILKRLIKEPYWKDQEAKI